MNKKTTALLALIMSAFVLTACSKNINRSAQRTLNGHWQLTAVNYSEPLVEVQAFGEFDAKCLEGSQWQFISNNNSGNYTISGRADCPVGTTNFSWFVDNNNMLALKRVFPGQSARNVTQGYFFNMSNATEQGFDLIQNVDGLNIRYRFVRSVY